MRQVIVRTERKLPASIEWKHRSLHILEITDHWKEIGRWWDQESPYEFFEVLTAAGEYLLGFRENEKLWYAKPVR